VRLVKELETPEYVMLVNFVGQQQDLALQIARPTTFALITGMNVLQVHLEESAKAKTARVTQIAPVMVKQDRVFNMPYVMPIQNNVLLARMTNPHRSARTTELVTLFALWEMQINRNTQLEYVIQPSAI
jgi:hypothetical protein